MRIGLLLEIVALMVLPPTTARASGSCHESSDSRAVGRTSCFRHRFGAAWEQPRGPHLVPSVELDQATHLLLLANRSFDLCAPGGSKGGECPSLGQASGTALGARVGWTTGGRLALPFALAWGPVRWTPVYGEVGGGSVLGSELGTITYLAAGTSLGVAHSWGSFIVRADLMLGVGGGASTSPSSGGQPVAAENDFFAVTTKIRSRLLRQCVRRPRRVRCGRRAARKRRVVGRRAPVGDAALPGDAIGVARWRTRKAGA